MLRHLRTRRRHRYGAHICSLIAAALLLFSVSLLYRRLSFFNSHPQHPYPLPHDFFNPLLDDLDTEGLTTSRSKDDRIDELDDNNSDGNEEFIPEEEEEDSVQNQNPVVSSSYFFDLVSGAVRGSFNRRSIEEWEDYVPFNLKLASDLGFGEDYPKPMYGSDDIIVDEKLRKKLSEVKKIEDALLLKGSVLREGWGEWFDKKGEFLRRDRMFKSNIEALNPLNNPILQDPDGTGVTWLTRGDRIFLKGIMNEFKRTPFLIKKPLDDSESEVGIQGNKHGVDDKTVRRVERRILDDDDIRKVSNEGLEKYGKRWGNYPSLDGRLSFGSFIDAFFRRGRCKVRVFMVWNSPAWMFGVRQQRGLESLLYHHHSDACVVVFSETIELDFFSGFVKDGYQVAVVIPDLNELLKDTPAHMFAVQRDWRKTRYYPTHYSELIRLAALYKYGGIYLDSDVLVLKSLSELNNTVACEDELSGRTLNGAMMAFRKRSAFIMACLKEFNASYNDSKLRWNGADLLTRVANKFLSNKHTSDMKTELQLQPASVFFPIGQNSILRYFNAPRTESEKLEQDLLFSKTLNKSVTVHFWNSLTSTHVPDSESLVFRLLNHYCIRCSDAL